jgi:hypothetical protein
LTSDLPAGTVTRVRTVILLRHGKSSWSDPTLADLDRPLAPRGERASRIIAKYIRRKKIHPARVLCSPRFARARRSKRSSLRSARTLPSSSSRSSTPPRRGNCSSDSRLFPSLSARSCSSGTTQASTTSRVSSLRGVLSCRSSRRSSRPVCSPRSLSTATAGSLSGQATRSSSITSSPGSLAELSGLAAAGRGNNKVGREVQRAGSVAKTRQ